MFVEQANGRFWLNDFKVFYSAATALVTHEPVYGVAFGLDTGFYKYSPFTLLLFTPYTLLSYPVASTIHFWIIVIFTLALIFILSKLIKKHIINNFQQNLLSYVILLVYILNHLIRELHLGNTNVILLFLLTLGLHYSIKKRYLFAGLLLGTVILTKPYFLILVLPFLLYKKWKLIFYTGTAILGLIGLSVLLIGYDSGIQLYQEWIVSMSNHSGYITSSNTLLSIIETYFTIPLPNILSYILLAIFSLVLYLLFWQKKIDEAKGIILYFFLLIASVPNFLITDTEHFLFSIPIVLIILTHTISHKEYISIFPLLLLIFMYGGNSSDLVGQEYSTIFYDLGLLGISNLILLGWLLYLIFSKKIVES